MRTRTKRSGEIRMMDAAELACYLSMGTNGAHEFAEKAGAVIRIGRRVRYDRERIDAMLDTLLQREEG